MSFTVFWDMHSGGSTKIEPYGQIYIEAKKNIAIAFFKDKFGRDPENITCNCCGSDYSISEYHSLAQATAYHRKLRYASPIEPIELKNQSYFKKLEWRNINCGKYFEPDEKIPKCFELRDHSHETGQTIEEYLSASTDILIVKANEIR